MTTGRRHDVTLTRGWVSEGTRLLLDAVDRLPDESLGGPSRLPGWSRAHVLAHVARNGEALGRLARWARTGVETPMYPDRATRDADIERTARQDPASLRLDLTVTATALDRALDGLDERTWGASVRAAASGREVRTTVVPWLRVREVWLHRVDLELPGAEGAGALAAAPDDLVDELLADVAGTMSIHAACPRVVLAPGDRDAAVPIGSPGDDRTTVGGSSVDLLLWVTGRSGGHGLVTAAGLPPLPRWL